MAASVAKVCDPESYELGEAIQQAKNGAEVSPGFEIEIVRYLQSHCFSRRVTLATVFRGLEVLGGMLGRGEMDEKRLIALLRPFLKSNDPQIASKCVLVLGRQSKSTAWINGIMSEPDDRMRANLIEALWRRKEPEIEQFLKTALNDPHRRVIANAAYGLYLLGVEAWRTGLDKLLSSDNPAFRISGLWVLKATAAPDAAEQVRQFISDPDPGVSRAAFSVLVALRNRATADQEAAEAVPVP